MAIVFSIIASTEVRRYFSPLILAFAAIEAGLVAAIVWATEPVPESFVQYAGYDAYRVPSVYTQGRGHAPGARSSMEIQFCYESLKGYYESMLFGCERTTFYLSKSDVTSAHDVSYSLDRRSYISRKGDRIDHGDVDRFRLEGELSGAGHALAGYSFVAPLSDAKSDDRLRIYPGAVHMVLDSDRRIVKFVSCSFGYPTCMIYTQTEAGMLTYEYRGSQHFDYDVWEEHERRILALLASWRIGN